MVRPAVVIAPERVVAGEVVSVDVHRAPRVVVAVLDYRGFVDLVGNDVVVEPVRPGERTDQSSQLLLRIFRVLRNREPGVVPASFADHFIEPEWLGGQRREHKTGSVLTGAESALAVLVPDLVAAAGAHLGIVARIQGKEDAHPSVGVVVEHHQVAIALDIHLELDPFTLPVAPVVVHPELDGGIAGRHDGAGGNGEG
jgi:hypothetical protein